MTRIGANKVFQLFGGSFSKSDVEENIREKNNPDLIHNQRKKEMQCVCVDNCEIILIIGMLMDTRSMQRHIQLRPAFNSKF